MKLSIAAFFGLAVPAFAQSPSLISQISQFPKCAIPCLADAITHTKCSMDNSACICADQALQQSVTVCVLHGCPVIEALQVRNLTATACNEPIRDRSGRHRIVSDTLGIISAFFVIQRFAYKIWAKLDIGLDDAFLLLTIVSGAPSTVMNAYGLGPNGIGRDVWTLTADNITKFGYFFFFIELLYFVEVATLKLSLLFFYLRIFPERKVQRLLWGTVVFVALFGIIFVFLAIFQCTPISYFWTKWDGEHKGSCIDINALSWSNAAISIALDAWMLALPFWQLKGLQLNWKKKIGVGLMICVGTFVTVVSILRLSSLVEFRADSLNPTWDFFNVALWSDIEINVGIICVCMPSLRVLLTRIFPKMLGTSQKSYGMHSGTASKSGPDRTSRKFGTSVTISAQRDTYGGPIKMNRISQKREIGLEYGDNDEVNLVHKRDIDGRSQES